MKPDYPLLGLLARQPSSGYELGKWLRTEGIFLGRKASMSPVYRALADFLARGWIDVEVRDGDAAPDAKVYSLNEAGRAALVEWAGSEYVPAPRPMAPDFIVRLNFAGQLGIDYALRIVETELNYRRAQRAAEYPHRHNPRDGDPIPEIDPDWLTYIDLAAKARGWEVTSLYIGWLENRFKELTVLKSRDGRGLPFEARETGGEE